MLSEISQAQEDKDHNFLLHVDIKKVDLMEVESGTVVHRAWERWQERDG